MPREGLVLWFPNFFCTLLPGRTLALLRVDFPDFFSNCRMESAIPAWVRLNAE